MPDVFDEQQAREMTRAGADLLVAHAGLTTKGSIGARSATTLEQAAAFVQRIIDTGKHERGDVLVLCHGGPIAEPPDVAFIVEHTSGLDGFFGASSIERSLLGGDYRADAPAWRLAPAQRRVALGTMD